MGVSFGECLGCETPTFCEKTFGRCPREIRAPNAMRREAGLQPFPTTSVLDDAAALVGGDRQADYGHPADDFARTAALWRAQFGWDVKPEDVAIAMALVKLSRLRESPGHRDSVVDWAGYAQTYWLARTGHS